MSTKSHLLKLSELPHQAIEFNKVSEDDYMPALDEAIELAKENVEKIKAETNPNFSNTIEALEFSMDWVGHVSHLFYNALSAKTSEKLQELAKEFGPKNAALSNDITLDEELFAKVKTVFDNKDNENLNEEQLKLLEESYMNFVRNGANLSSDDKETLRKIDGELSQLAPQFSANCLKAINAFELKVTDPKDVEGMPESVLESAKAEAEQKDYKDTWLFTMQAPSFVPFMKYCPNRELRKQMATAFALNNTSGDLDNRELILKTVKLRDQKAKLLGFKTHAEYVLSKRMAETPDRVWSFLNELLDHAKPACINEVQEMQSFVDEMGGPNPLQSWDFAFYSDQLKKKKFSFDEEELRPYFPLQKVIDGAFAVASKLYNLNFKQNEDLPKYHPDVKVYEVYRQDKFIGLFYADFFPRESKRSGAWMTEYRSQGYFMGEVKRPHIAIVCNFTKPTPNKPALLTFREVQTLFHEFGHALHGLMSQCTYSSLAGTSVYWDFVELPSQVMENWILEKEALDLFAKHYETNEPIPADLVEKLKASSQFQAGYMNMRQLNFAYLDMYWHTTAPEKINDVIDFEISATENVQILPRIEGGSSSTGFQHIFAGGYSAGYYSYKWAEVLDADAFEFFKENGIFNAEVADKFRTNILEKGGTAHPMELYKKFRGREPDTKALLRRDGLI